MGTVDSRLEQLGQRLARERRARHRTSALVLVLLAVAALLTPVLRYEVTPDLTQWYSLSGVAVDVWAGATEVEGYEVDLGPLWVVRVSTLLLVLALAGAVLLAIELYFSEDDQEGYGRHLRWVLVAAAVGAAACVLSLSVLTDDDAGLTRAWLLWPAAVLWLGHVSSTAD